MSTDKEMLKLAVRALDTLLDGADDVLDNFLADHIVDDLSQAMDGLRDDAKHARAALYTLKQEGAA